MKLQKIRFHLGKAIQDLEVGSGNTTISGTAYVKLTGLVRFRKAIRELEQTELFSSTIDFIKHSEIFKVGEDEVNIAPHSYKGLTDRIDSLRQSVLDLFGALSQIIPDEKPDTIYIKLPPVGDFQDLAKIGRDFQIIFDQVITNEPINAEIKIEYAEPGSIWLDVTVGASALTVVAALAWSGAVIAKKIQEGRYLAQITRERKIINDSKQAALDAHKKLLEFSLQMEAAAIEEKFFQGKNDPELHGRIQNSINTLAEQITKGAEIHPALTAPEQVSNLFPNLKSLPDTPVATLIEKNT